jgi:hypothetical protein
LRVLAIYERVEETLVLGGGRGWRVVLSVMQCGEGNLLFDSTIIIDNEVSVKFTDCQEGNAAVAEEAALLWIPELLWVDVQELAVGNHAWAWDVHIML